MNRKHKALADAILSGVAPIDAAQGAGYRGSRASLSSTASRIMTRGDVSAYCARVREQADDAEDLLDDLDPQTADIAQVVFDRTEVLARLSSIASDPNSPTRDVLKALDQLARCLGLYSQHYVVETPQDQREELDMSKLSLETLNALERELYGPIGAVEDDEEDDFDDAL